MEVEKMPVLIEDEDDPLPMSTMNKHQLVVTDPKRSVKIAGLPTVRINFWPTQLDKKWMRANKLFRSKRLPGCVGLKVDTAKATQSYTKRISFVQ